MSYLTVFLKSWGMSLLYVDDNLYIIQRSGYQTKPGLIYVLNNAGDHWNGTQVNTRWQNTTFTPAAWWSKNDRDRPYNWQSDAAGNGQFYAAPRGFAVYAPA